MKHNKVVNKKNQAPNITNSSLLEDFFNDIYNNSPKVVNLLDVIVHYTNIFDQVDPSQGTIALKAGITRTYVNQVIKKLDDKGIIEKIWRPFRTCIYKLNPAFNDLQLRKKFQHMFKSFRWLPKNMLLSFRNKYNEIKENTFQRRKLTLLTNTFPLSLNIYSKNIVTSTSDTVATLGRGSPEGVSVTNRKEGSMKKLLSELEKEWKEENNQTSISTGRQPAITKDSLQGFLQKDQEYWDKQYATHVSKVVRDLPELNKAAKIKLSVYPDDVLRYALSKMLPHSKLDNAYQYLSRICANQAQKANVEPNWSILQSLPDQPEVPTLSLPLRSFKTTTSSNSGGVVKRYNTKTNQNRSGYTKYNGNDNNPSQGNFQRIEWKSVEIKVESQEEIKVNLEKTRQSEHYAKFLALVGEDVAQKCESNLFKKENATEIKEECLDVVAGGDLLTVEAVEPKAAMISEYWPDAIIEEGEYDEVYNYGEADTIG